MKSQCVRGDLSRSLFPDSSGCYPPTTSTHVFLQLFLSSAVAPFPVSHVTTRQVSKQINDITYNLEIWMALYTNARLPRPPGPFPSQSAELLENTLVKSERLAPSWTTQPMKDISNVRIRIPKSGSSPSRNSEIMHGKWLVGCESSSKFVVYDLDSDPVEPRREVLWESVSSITLWAACPAVSTRGLLIHIVFRTEHEPLKLLEFHLNGNTLEHTLTLDVPTRRSNDFLRLEGGRSPFSYIVDYNLVFDAETRLFYEFPDFISPLAMKFHGALGRSHRNIYLSKTHIIITIVCIENLRNTSFPTVVQAFTTPANSRLSHDGTGVFVLSHEGLIPGISVFAVDDPIRNSIVDVATGAINIRLLYHVHQNSILRLCCLDLTLPENRSMGVVLPITFDHHDITQLHSQSKRHPIQYIETSGDGHVRGFFRLRVSTDNGDHVVRFTIDASQDRCVGVVGQISRAQWTQECMQVRWTGRRERFEGLSGRVFFAGDWWPGLDSHDTFVITIK